MNTEMKYVALSYLCTKDTPTTSAVLQKALHCSRRSVINYVNQLNQEVDGLVLSSPKGYEISDKARAIALLQKQTDQFEYQGYEKRKQYILEKLLLHQDNATLQEFADELFVSSLTVQKDLLRLRTELKPHRLIIRTKNERLFILGEKKDRQAYLMDLLSQEWQASKFSLESIQNFFDTAQMNEIHQIVDTILKEANYDLDDFSMFNYVLHLSICIETTLNIPSLVSDTLNDVPPFSVHFQRLVEVIYQELKRRYPRCGFTPAQIAEASMLMSTRIASLRGERLTIKNMDTLAGPQVKKLISTIITSVYNNYGINLNDEEFIICFAYHLKNLLLRMRDNLRIPSSPLLSIQEEYPFLSMIAGYITSIIAAELGQSVAENETLYIALHVGAFLENKESTEKIFCDLIMLDYLNLSEQLFKELSSSIPDLVLNQVRNSYETVNPTVDFVITTLPESPFLSLPQIQVHPLITHEDIRKVAEKVEELKRERECAKLKKQFQRLLNKDLFFFDKSFDEGKSLIRFLCHNLESHAFVDTEFIQEIYNHERVMPTEYNNVAIPHPLLSNGNHVRSSVIAVWLNKHPVTWIHNSVNFVFMLALLPEDLALFSEIFDIITSVIAHKEAAEKLLDCSDLNEFIDQLLDKYKTK